MTQRRFINTLHFVTTSCCFKKDGRIDCHRQIVLRSVLQQLKEVKSSKFKKNICIDFTTMNTFSASFCIFKLAVFWRYLCLVIFFRESPLVYNSWSYEKSRAAGHEFYFLIYQTNNVNFLDEIRLSACHFIANT